MTDDSTDWAAVALAFARDAFTHHFASRRGLWTIDDRPGVVVLYDNHPHVSAPGLRGREMAAATVGCASLAWEQWPVDGPDAGYTAVAVVRGDPAAIRAAWARELGEDLALLDVAGRGRPD